MKNLIIFVLALFLAGAIVAGFIFHGKYENTGEKLQASNEKLSSLNVVEIGLNSQTRNTEKRRKVHFFI